MQKTALFRGGKKRLARRCRGKDSAVRDVRIGDTDEDDETKGSPMQTYMARRLEHTFRTLDARIKKLDRRGSHMTPSERTLSQELKRARLQVLDRLSALR